MPVEQPKKMNHDEIRQIQYELSSVWLYTGIIVILEISLNLLIFWQSVWDVKD